MFHDSVKPRRQLAPPIDRTEPLVLELRLRILTALSQWELGESVANVLITSAIEPARCRDTCARFHHARARYLCETGDHKAARLAMRAASDAWPEIRIELVDDERLAAGGTTLVLNRLDFRMHMLVYFSQSNMMQRTC